MINTKTITDKINARLAGGGLDSTQTCALNGALTTLENTSVVQVASLASLPSAATYIGRMVYVQDIEEYRFSTGLVWTNDYQLYRSSAPAYSWGSNTNGRLGDNTSFDKSSPISVVGGFTDWCQVSAGGLHTAAIRQNGTLWAWGGNVGQLGDNTTVSKSSPVSVAGGFIDWCQVSAGVYHTAAVRQNGTLWAWGFGSCGRLGDGTVSNRSSPASVVGGFTDWCQVSAGCQHTAAVRKNGTLWAWGNGADGRLGDGTQLNRSSPVSVVGGFTDWCQVSAGCPHTAAIRQNGTLWSWGGNTYGQLGDGTQLNISSPISVIGGFTDWCQVSAGCRHTAAVRQNGTLWAWGSNTNGRLGDNTSAAKSSPVSVIGGFTDWCQVSAGSSHTAAVRQNGTLWAWGLNTNGRLGDNTTTSRVSPVSVVGGLMDWSQVSAGCLHTAAIQKITRTF